MPRKTSTDNSREESSGALFAGAPESLMLLSPAVVIEDFSRRAIKLPIVQAAQLRDIATSLIGLAGRGRECYRLFRQLSESCPPSPVETLLRHPLKLLVRWHFFVNTGLKPSSIDIHGELQHSRVRRPMRVRTESGLNREGLVGIFTAGWSRKSFYEGETL